MNLNREITFLFSIMIRKTAIIEFSFQPIKKLILFKFICRMESYKARVSEIAREKAVEAYNECAERIREYLDKLLGGDAVEATVQKAIEASAEAYDDCIIEEKRRQDNYKGIVNYLAMTDEELKADAVEHALHKAEYFPPWFIKQKAKNIQTALEEDEFWATEEAAELLRETEELRVKSKAVVLSREEYERLRELNKKRWKMCSAHQILGLDGRLDKWCARL